MPQESMGRSSDKAAGVVIVIILMVFILLRDFILIGALVGVTVVDKDVALTIGVIDHEVGGFRFKGHKPPI
ncbi:MAG: hypothetical protein AMK69_03975 [Nitrospira bacterium SG8_3]|nr:MAG: hypothetical protein AMK69_03975 [Nitrospira bacterium SG8_3]